MSEIEVLVKLVQERKWVAASAVLIWAVVRLLKLPNVPWPFSKIPTRARSLVAIVLGIAAGSLDAIVNGTGWQAALINGLVSAAMAVLGHEIFVEWLRGGKEPFSKPKSGPPLMVLMVFLGGMTLGACGYGKPACAVIDVLHQNCVWIQYLEDGKEKRVRVSRQELEELGKRASARQQVQDAGDGN